MLCDSYYLALCVCSHHQNPDTNLALIRNTLLISIACVGKVVHDTGYDGREYGVHTHDHPGISLGFRNGDSSNDHVGSRINVGGHAVQYLLKC